MPSVNLVTTQLQFIGENLIRVNNLVSHMGTEIKSLQSNLRKAIGDLQGTNEGNGEGKEPCIPDENFTTSEIQELHALEESRRSIVQNFQGIESKRRAIIDRARERKGATQ